ncbi:hypothetical protein [Pseudaquidulcibacter saccharophilus]|uniref:hypothetical protein n=1 Tax=Pseudaquidulcibacter saccharophilus TaxID=2831900 RepID=UPI001EFF4073|nr:hypothetical protein [Pseudaquidulcibacter saccharophilus]
MAELISAAWVCQEMSGFLAAAHLISACQQMSTFSGDAKIRTNKRLKTLISNSFI